VVGGSARVSPMPDAQARARGRSTHARREVASSSWVPANAPTAFASTGSPDCRGERRRALEVGGGTPSPPAPGRAPAPIRALASLATAIDARVSASIDRAARGGDMHTTSSARRAPPRASGTPRRGKRRLGRWPAPTRNEATSAAVSTTRARSRCAIASATRAALPPTQQSPVCWSAARRSQGPGGSSHAAGAQFVATDAMRSGDESGQPRGSGEPGRDFARAEALYRDALATWRATGRGPMPRRAARSRAAGAPARRLSAARGRREALRDYLRTGQCRRARGAARSPGRWLRQENCKARGMS